MGRECLHAHSCLHVQTLSQAFRVSPTCEPAAGTVTCKYCKESLCPSPANDKARINKVCAHGRPVIHRGGESALAMRTAINIFSRSVWVRSCLPTCTWRARRALCRAQNDSSSGKDNRLNQADALTQSLSSVSNNSGRVAQTRNFVMGSDHSEASWRALDEQVICHV